MNDKRVDEILELKKELEKHDIDIQEWLAYLINKNILDIRMEIIVLRKMVEEVHHTVMLMD